MKGLPKAHIAILIKEDFIFDYEVLGIKRKPKDILFFTEKTITNLVLEESKRDSSVILEREGQTLRTMSSGERKLAVLKYLLHLKPTFLFVDTIHENLDSKNLLLIDELLRDYAKVGYLIQVMRKASIPLIRSVAFFNFHDNSLIPYKGTIEEYFDNENTNLTLLKIPDTTTNFIYNYKNFVNLRNVTIKFFDKVVLKNIDWQINLGEFWQLIGENGSGKTTLLSLITGDSHKAYGQNIILFDKLKGTEENVWEIKQKIGYFTPNITELFNRRHSVLHMVLSGFYDSVGLYVKPLDSHIALAKEWIELIGLSEFLNSTFMTLPLSKQRMVLIARAMVKHPPLLILDEPTSGLDAESTQLIVKLINRIGKQTKTTIIYVSHRMEDGLTPDKTYKLSKSSSGSTGEIL